MGIGKNIKWFGIGFASAVALVGGGVALAVCAVPSSAYLGDKVSGQAASDSILKLFSNLDSYQMGDLPIVKDVLQSVITNYNLGNLIEIDFDSLDGKAFKEIDFSNLIGTSVKIIASIDSLDLADQLGSFADLHIMTSYDEVASSEVISPSEEAFNPHLYYYKNGETYSRAYKDDKTAVAGYTSQTLYYPAMRKIPVTEIGYVFETRLGQQPAGEALKAMGMESTSTVVKLVKDKTFGELSSLNIDDMYLNDILPYAENPSLYDTILPILNDSRGDKLTNETIKVSDLENISLDNIHLSSVVTNLDSDMEELLAEGCGVSSYSEIMVSTLSSFSLDNIHLSRVMPNVDSKLKAIILDITGSSSWEDLTVASLQSSLDMDAIHLSSVIDTSSSIFSILQDGLGGVSGDSITIGDLESFDVNNVHLSSIILEEDNQKLYAILKDMTGLSAEEITISSLKTIDTDSIKIKTVLSLDSEGKTGNAVLDAMLEKDPTVGELVTTFENLTVYETYCDSSFTVHSENAISINGSKDTYDLGEDGSFTYNASGSGKYYISKDSSIWLLLGFEKTLEASTGRSTKYSPSSLKIADLSSSTSNFKTSIMNAPIYQLIACGMLDGDGMSSSLLPKTLNEVIEIAKAATPGA